MKKPDFALRLRLVIGRLYEAAKIINECHFHIAGCADEIERLTQENKKLKRELKKKP